MIAIATALGDGAPRRLAFAVPAQLGLTLRHRPVALLAHPGLSEVAVLDDRVDQATLHAIDHDPRWATHVLATDRSIAGGWSALLVLALVAVAMGIGFGAALVRVAG